MLDVVIFKKSRATLVHRLSSLAHLTSVSKRERWKRLRQGGLKRRGAIPKSILLKQFRHLPKWPRPGTNNN